MRLLFTIPHYFAWDPEGNYGSERNAPENRAVVIRRCIASLLQTFSAGQALMNGKARHFHPVNPRFSAEVTVVVCTTGDSHLVSQLDGVTFTHMPTQAEPRYLGFECHKVMRDAAGQYDYFGYLEDDLQVADALFFNKLGWFTAQLGNRAVLQPNRFELMDEPLAYKLYIDGNMHDDSVARAEQNMQERRRIDMPLFGHSLVFQRVGNPHSGCFFLNAAQLAHWIAQPDFAVPSAVFGGPLESAATLGIMRHFRVYKPARENAAFFEIEHLDPRYLGRRFWPTAGDPPTMVWP